MYIMDNTLKNFLKLPKASNWLYYEWFYSDMDNVIFGKENEFMTCLQNSFPNLRSTNLTKMQWCRIRKLLGKPRRCSHAFFEEERASLKLKRDKMRLLWQLDYDKTTDVTALPLVNNFIALHNSSRSHANTNESVSGFPSTSNQQRGAVLNNNQPQHQVPQLVEEFFTSDLPALVPHPPIIGARVVARVREPCDGMYRGRIIAIDHAKWEYRVAFDHSGLLGTQSVPDFEIASWKAQSEPEMLSITSVIKINRLLSTNAGGAGGINAASVNANYAVAAAALAVGVSSPYHIAAAHSHFYSQQYGTTGRSIVSQPPPWLLLSPRGGGSGNAISFGGSAGKASSYTQTYKNTMLSSTLASQLLLSPLTAVPGHKVLPHLNTNQDGSITRQSGTPDSLGPFDVNDNFSKHQFKRPTGLVLEYPRQLQNEATSSALKPPVLALAYPMPFANYPFQAPNLSVDDWRIVLKHNVELERDLASNQATANSQQKQTVLGGRGRLETLVRVAACYKLLMYKAKHIDSLKRINREAEKMQHLITQPSHGLDGGTLGYPEEFRVRYAELIIKIKQIDRSLKSLCERISDHLISDLLQTCKTSQLEGTSNNAQNSHEILGENQPIATDGMELEKNGEIPPDIVKDVESKGITHKPSKSRILTKKQGYYHDASIMVNKVLTANIPNYPKLKNLCQNYANDDNNKTNNKNEDGNNNKNNNIDNSSNGNMSNIMELITQYTALLFQLKETPSSPPPLPSELSKVVNETLPNADDGKITADKTGQPMEEGELSRVLSPRPQNRIQDLTHIADTPFETLMETVAEIRGKHIHPQNVTFFQDNVEVHINHLKNIIFQCP